MKEIRLGICGLGTVGGGVLDLIKSNADRLYDQVGAPVRVVKIGSRTKKPLFNDEEISFYQDVLLLADDPDIDIVTPAVQLKWEELDEIREAKKTLPFSGTMVVMNEKNHALWFSKQKR